MINIIKTFYYILKQYKVTLIMAIIFMMSMDLFTYLLPLAISYVIDNIYPKIHEPGMMRLTIIAGLIIIFAGFIRGIIINLMIRFYWYLSEVMVRDLRSQLYEKLQYLSASFYAKSNTGDLMSRITTDIQLIRNFFAYGIEHRIRIILISLTIFSIMIYQNWKLALVVYSFIPLVIIVIILFSKKLDNAVITRQKQAGKLSTILQENLRGIRIIKAFAVEEDEKTKFDYENKKLRDKSTLIGVLQAKLDPILIMTGGIGTLIVVFYGGYQVINNTMSLGILVAFSTYLMIMRFPLMILALNTSTIALAHGASKRINEILYENDQRVESTGTYQKNIQGHLIFKKISFNYDDDNSNSILKNLSFNINPGEHVAVFGLTGSGKSSLISLIPRFYNPTEGTIILDSIDLSKWDIEYLRSQISVILQETFLFSVSIKDNIAFACPLAKFEDIKKAAKSAKIDDFITSLPEGYETVVGEYGIGLSGGQRQRIAIARAILKNPKILILDDCTSSLDPETEKEIQKELRILMKNRTTIIIAQRISSLKLADRIIVLDRGKIQDFDSHEALLKKNDLYRNTYKTQMSYFEDICEDSMSMR
ncbi:MAG: ABC transporter ATP-binding protein [Clostridiales bacterium]